MRTVDRREATRLRLTLDAGAEARARDLVARQSECCSFFAFAVSATAEDLVIDVEVPETHVAVLDALTARAAHASAG